jgi:hypothetical protein
VLATAVAGTTATEQLAEIREIGPSPTVFAGYAIPVELGFNHLAV